eukprot:SAG31_NODE_786_length_12098_cov_15.117446_7_plen_45_part_00
MTCQSIHGGELLYEKSQQIEADQDVSYNGRNSFGNCLDRHRSGK